MIMISILPSFISKYTIFHKQMDRNLCCFILKNMQRAGKWYLTINERRTYRIIRIQVVAFTMLVSEENNPHNTCIRNTLLHQKIV